MLSEYERRQLALMEQGLAEDDRRLAEPLRPRRTSRRRYDRRWMSRSLLAFGVLLVVVGLLTATDGLFMQGMLFGGAAVLWLRWQGKVTATPAPGAPPRRSGSEPSGGTAQGWSRPA